MRVPPLVPCALLAAALGCAQQLSHAPATDYEMVIGEGAHRYGWDPQWGSLPEGMEVGATHGGLTVDAQGRVLVSTDSANAVLALQPDGSVDSAWGEALSGGLHGLTVAGGGDEQTLWMVHTAQHRIVHCTQAVEVLLSIAWPEASGKYESAKQFKPTGIAVAPDGRFWVADGYGRGWVHAYDADGNWLHCWGGPGSEDGQFKTPHGISYDGRGATPRLLVADRENHRLQAFDLDGRVTLVDRDDQVVVHLGEQHDPAMRSTNRVTPDQWQDGTFTSPHGATWGLDGALYVQDWSLYGRLIKLMPVQG